MGGLIRSRLSAGKGGKKKWILLAAAAVLAVIAAVQTLTSAKADAEDFFLQDGDWYVESGRQEYRVSDRVQIHLTEADLWLEGAEGLASVLADGYTLTLYYDRSADEGGQVRLITAQ